MGIFSRRSGRRAGPSAAGQVEAIDAFWRWWSQRGALEVATAIADGSPDRAVPALGPRVEAVHPQLGWELGPGPRASRHLLVVSAEGNPELRAAARRWLLAAPAADELWEYADARQPVLESGGLALEVAGVELEYAAARLAARVEGPAVHVSVHHPAFERLPQDARRMAAFLMLDNAVGENDVEAWIGEITVSPVEPVDAITLDGLPAVVRHLRDEFTDDEGNPAWLLLQGNRGGRPLLATAQVPLRSVTAPQFDTHVEVTLPFARRTDGGLPEQASLDALRAMEDHLGERLGGSGRLVAHETWDGSRVLHYYVDGATPAAAQLEAAVAGWSEGRPAVAVKHDPAWEAVAHLRP